MTRPRLTIGRMMAAIAAVGWLMALFGEGTEAALLLGFALAIAAVAWLPARRSPRLARWALVASASWVNLALGASYLLEPHLRGHSFELAMLASVPLIPAVAGSGLAWAGLRPTRAAKARAAVLVAALIALPASMIATGWPFRVGFDLSAPALDRLASRVETGGSFAGPEWAGLYRIEAIRRMPGGGIGLVVDSDRWGDRMFLRGGSPPRPGTGRGPSLPVSPGVGGRWSYTVEQ